MSTSEKDYEIGMLQATEAQGQARSVGQFNLFTGEVEPIPGPGVPGSPPETPWLFDPDFGLVLPENPTGKEILVEEGIALNFPGPEGQVAGNRSQGTGKTIANHQSQIANRQCRTLIRRRSLPCV